MSRAHQAFLASLPIGLLAGLIGLGGGEFRLPLLILLFALSGKAAVPLNLVVSLVTLTAAFALRATTLPALDLAMFGPAVLGLAIGAVTSAFLAPELLRHLSDHRFEQILAVLLFGIGCLLIGEAAVPFIPLGLAAGDTAAGFATGIAFGLAIGVVAALLGVAGGEFLVPTMIVVFGASAIEAGTASLLVSIPTVLSGLVRYRNMGLLPRRAELRTIALPMGVGSIAGAALGAVLAPLAPEAALEAILGLVLIAAAGKVLLGRR